MLGRGSHEEARCFAVRLPVDVTRSGYMGLKFQSCASSRYRLIHG
jgi:hypothetical protein